MVEILDKYWYGDDINNSYGEEIMFCSQFCVREFRLAHFCAECKRRLRQSYYHNDDIDIELGDEFKFCGQGCIRNFRIKHLCAECGSELGRRYTYCRRCGKNRYRFCDDYCFEDHNEGHSAGGDDDCPISTVVCNGLGLADDCSDLTILREFRDSYLMKHGYSKEVIDYYSKAQGLADKISTRAEIDPTFLRTLYVFYIQPSIHHINDGNFKDAHKKLNQYLQFIKGM
jgi:hypothetical protein